MATVTNLRLTPLEEPGKVTDEEDPKPEDRSFVLSVEGLVDRLVDTGASLAGLKTARGVLKRLILPVIIVMLALTAVSIIHSANTDFETLDQDVI